MSTNVKFEVPTMKKLNNFQKLVYENGGPEKVRIWIRLPKRERNILGEFFYNPTNRSLCEARISTDKNDWYSFDNGYRVRLIPCDDNHHDQIFYMDDLYGLYNYDEGWRIKEDGEFIQPVETLEKVTNSAYIVHLGEYICRR